MPAEQQVNEADGISTIANAHASASAGALTRSKPVSAATLTQRNATVDKAKRRC